MKALKFTSLTLFSLLFWTVLGFAQNRTASELAEPLDYVPGEVLIKFRAGAPPGIVNQALYHIGGRHVKTFAQIGVRHWRAGRGISTEVALARLSRPPFKDYIEYAEPNYLLHASQSAVYPNDLLRGRLWAMHNIGQTGGKKDADIDAPQAWILGGGSDAVIVGMIDTGFDYNHPDLAANIWTNETELNGQPGVDDDGNGYVDDVHGWDFFNNDNDPMDDNGHGTHTAGTVAAVGNNGLGVMGVAWNVKLMALKFLGAGGSGPTSAAIGAILYAAHFQVPITSNSWGGGKSSRALQDAIAGSGALFVAAAGNSNTSSKQYPAGYALANIISVGATDANDVRASFSNYGSWVHLGAPGVDILSTLPSGKYGLLSGTSMAAPHVAGVAALMKSRNAALSPAELRTTILNSADSISGLTSSWANGLRLNAARAVGITPQPSTDTSPPSAVSDLSQTGNTTNSISLSWTAVADNDGGSGTYLYDLRYSTVGAITDSNWASATPVPNVPIPQSAGASETFALTDLNAGTTYHIALKVADAAGNYSPLSTDLAASTVSGPHWVVDTVAASGSGSYSSLAFDGSGKPTIAYSGLNNTIMFAAKAGSAWTSQTVGTGGPGISLAYNLSGRPTISHGWGKLNFLQFNGSSWLNQVIDTARAYNDVTSLVYGPDGYPWISYRTYGGSGGLKLAHWTGTAWAIQVVDTGAGARYNSLALDDQNRPAIAYSDDVDGDNWLDTLKYAHFNGTSWDISEVRTGVKGDGVFASLAFDSEHRPAMVHDAGGTIEFVYKDSNGTWQDEPVAVGSQCSLAIDSNSTAWVSYSTETETRVAFRLAGSSPSWQTESVDRDFAASFIIHLVIAPNGQPAVSYDGFSEGLRFAQRVE